MLLIDFMIKIPGRIPIFIHPTFWLLSILIGFMNGGGNLLSILIWVGIIFVSVLFHEMGHAITALLFGRNPRIELVALGGLTYHDGSKLALWKQFFITLNGPLFGFLLVIIATILLSIPALIQNPFAITIIKLFQVVNFFWTIVNLLPVIPLDGGQLLRIIFEGWLGVKGISYSLFFSMVLALLISLAAFFFQSFLLGAFFFLFAYNGYESWRQAKMMAQPDQQVAMSSVFESAEQAMKTGRKVEAITLFEQVRHATGKGLLYLLSTQYLAFLKYELGNVQEAHDLLCSIRTQLNEEALVLLHRVAFEIKNYTLVGDLSGAVFQFLPNVETALRNAYASAALGQVEPAIGWLETAHQEGLQNIKEIIQENDFDLIRHHFAFQKFIKSLNSSN